MNTTRTLLLSLATLAWASGCAPVEDAPDEGAQSILGGTSVNADQTGHVQVLMSFGNTALGACSGTLVTNDWVLTDRRCLESNGGVAPSTGISLAIGGRPKAYRTVQGSPAPDLTITEPGEVYVAMASQVVVASAIVRHPTLDLAMLRLARPMSVNGSATGFTLYPYFDWTAPATPPVVRCFGYGDGSTNPYLPSAPAVPWWQQPLRYADFTATALSATVTDLSTSTSSVNVDGSPTNLGLTAAITSGDTGGACMIGDKLHGVAHSCDFGGRPSLIAGGTNASRCRETPFSAFLWWMYETAAAFVVEPSNNARANAAEIPMLPYESTVAGTTVRATLDGPSVSCACTAGPNVWYRFTLGATEAVSLDTAGSGFDTSLLVTDASGAPVTAAACNDDAQCASGRFTSHLQSELRATLRAGTYYVAVGGCGSGRYVLNLRHRAESAPYAACRGG